MDLLKKVQECLATEELNPQEAVELLQQMGPKAKGIARRCGKNPHTKFLPHIKRELERYVRIRTPKPAGRTAKAKADAAKATPSAKPKKEEYVAPPLAKVFTEEEYLALPADVLAFSKENDKLQKVRAKARHSLELAENDEQRRLIAEQITEMTAQIDSNFSALEYFKKNGQLPEPVEEETEMTLAEAKDALRNARSRKSKAKNSAKKAKTKKTKAKYEAKEKEEAEEVFRLEELVKKLEEDALQSKGQG